MSVLHFKMRGKSIFRRKVLGAITRRRFAAGKSKYMAIRKLSAAIARRRKYSKTKLRYRVTGNRVIGHRLPFGSRYKSRR